MSHIHNTLPINDVVGAGFMFVLSNYSFNTFTKHHLSMFSESEELHVTS